MAGDQSNILIGTSGWSYRSWRGPFFPNELPARSHLEYYAERFQTTELNGVFYRTPTVEAVRGWAERTPDNFVFAGRRRSSSPIGSVSMTPRETASR